MGMATQTADDRTDETTTRTITLRLIVAYLGGVLAILNFLGALLVANPSVVLFAGAIAVSLPPLRRRVEGWTNTRLSTPAVVMLYIVFTFAGNTWLLATV